MSLFCPWCLGPGLILSLAYMQQETRFPLKAPLCRDARKQPLQSKANEDVHRVCFVGPCTEQLQCSAFKISFALNNIEPYNLMSCLAGFLQEDPAESRPSFLRVFAFEQSRVVSHHPWNVGCYPCRKYTLHQSVYYCRCTWCKFAPKM